MAANSKLPKMAVGQRYGRLVVLEFVRYSEDKRKEAIWKFRCDCGAELATRAIYVRTGDRRSCGCLSIENSILQGKTTSRTHGMYGTPEYRSWNRMHDRCRNEKHVHYDRYGGRGIKVCERWHKFENFYADMGNRPTGHSLDRIDNDGNYEPGNCRWATHVEQRRNRRDSIKASLLEL